MHSSIIEERKYGNQRKMCTCCITIYQRGNDHRTRGGSTIAYLVALIKESKKNIQVVTPSFTTAKLCIENQIPVLPTWSIDHLDLAFDGCDEVDLDLNALKSGGGIHTQEKIIASMAEDYILLVDESKVFDHLPFHHSLTLEVIPESLSYVIKEVKALGAEVKMRTSQAKDGVTISDNGNYILEASFKEVRNCATLNQLLSGITGRHGHFTFCR